MMAADLKPLIPVAEALDRLLAGVRPVDLETVDIGACNGRVLGADLTAKRTQPPFDASAMDGYAVRAADIASPPTTLSVIGEAPAGAAFSGTVGPGEAVRIFTGAPVPDGADAILIQENTQAGNGIVTALKPVETGRYIRKAGLDFATGEILIKAPRRLDFRDISLAAAMNHAALPVRRKPVVAILATGDELVMPGNEPGPDQIVASNSFGIAGLVADCGGAVMDLGLAQDDQADIARHIRPALDAEADILITLGGASVGDHDLILPTLGDAGMDLDFWRIAMRPGKPLMFGRLGKTRVLGLPGNPVSSLVCGLLFLRPLLDGLLGLKPGAAREVDAVLGAALPPNDQRQDFLRATLTRAGDGHLVATAFDKQDSSMLSVFSRADALIIRAPHAPEAAAGDPCRILPLKNT